MGSEADGSHDLTAESLIGNRPHALYRQPKAKSHSRSALPRSLRPRAKADRRRWAIPRRRGGQSTRRLLDPIGHTENLLSLATLNELRRHLILDNLFVVLRHGTGKRFSSHSSLSSHVFPKSCFAAASEVATERSLGDGRRTQTLSLALSGFGIVRSVAALSQV
jgi:hypothetical protein